MPSDGVAVNRTVRLTVVTAAYNEEQYLSRSLASVVAAIKKAEVDARIVVIADRCSDRTAEIARTFGAEVIVKDFTNWRHSLAETLELGLQRVVEGSDYVAVIDADVVIPPELFMKALETLTSDQAVAYVAPQLITESSTWFNRIYRIYERAIEPVRVTSGIRGACRVYRASSLQKIRQGQHILSDVAAPESYLDLKLQGHRVMLSDQRALHIRETTLRRSIQGQINAGRARRQLGVSFSRTLVHSVLRLRFFVLYGYLRSGRLERG